MSVRRVALSAIPALLALALIAPEAGAAPKPKPTPTPTPSPSPCGADEPPDHGHDIGERDARLGRARERLLDHVPPHLRERASSSSTSCRRRPPSRAPACRPTSPTRGSSSAVDMNGRPSADSNTVTYKTPPDTTAPPAPTLSAPLYVGPRLVELDWTDSVDETSSAVTYLVNRNGISTNYGNQSRAVVPLAPLTSYSISITARDNAGNTGTSNAISVTTPAADNTSPPSAPPNFMGFEVGMLRGVAELGRLDRRRRPALGYLLPGVRQRHTRPLRLRPDVGDDLRDPERDEHLLGRRRRQLGQPIGAERGRRPEHVPLLSPPVTTLTSS